ncbi:MAG: MurR/RpiR family transcriptional regulator [Caldilineaceae bacterium]|nr:MurR/RpiR family transcriptional regulator [Caldilineaceae bacterium]
MSAAADLEGRIAAAFDQLSPKQQTLARLILDNRYFASFASAAEIGEKVEASAATVVRLCQALGYQGLPDLQEAIRGELPSYLTAVERLERRMTVLPANGDIPQRTFATDAQNLSRTANTLAETNFAAVVDHLMAARKVVVVAAGVAAAPALFLAYSLQVAGLDAHALLDGDVTLGVNVAHLGAGDVVVGISVWRYIRSTVEAVIGAKANGAHTVAITDSIVSPLARAADYAFEVATEGVAHSLSVTAMMTLINALVAGVSLKDPQRTSQALQRVDQQFLSRNLLVT